MLRVGSSVIEFVRGDITKISVDAIVNAANSALAGGGGVDGAIHRAGGPEIMRELDQIRRSAGGCDTGKAVVTGAGRLPAKYVFHAVGPVYRGGKNKEAELLGSCYTTCLDLARQKGVHTISFPSISTGVYGYPVKEAAAVALDAIVGYLREKPDPPLEIKLVQFSESDHEVYRHEGRRFEFAQS